MKAAHHREEVDDALARNQLIPGEEEFEPRPMVAWFHPLELARTALRSVLAKVVTAYADTRMAIAGASAAASVADPGGADRWLGSEPVPDIIDLSNFSIDGSEEIWFDYLADTGEGFDATYAMACTVGRPLLEVEGLSEPLPRGKVLILGGDTVYPWPSRALYRDRFQVPFRWAMPAAGETREETGESLEGPLMLAIPGNHDWYDGLGNFLNVFCDGRRIGGWRTVQRRSYWALKLPHNWTVWGIDTQLSGSTDRSQMAYFRSLALNPAVHGDKVVLCTPRPAWLDAWGESRRSMRIFEEEVLRWPTDDPSTPGPDLPVVLSGDLHFYARHRKEAGCDGTIRHRIVCGGGGAYTRGTHDLPAELSLSERERPRGMEPFKPVRDRRSRPDTIDRERNRYVLAHPSYPDQTTSRQLALGALRFPLLAHNLPYCVGSGLLFAAIALIAQWASGLSEELPDFFPFLRSLGESVDVQGWGGVPGNLWSYGLELLYLHPVAAVPPALTVIAFLAFFVRSNPAPPRWTKWLVGVIWVVLATALYVWMLIVIVGAIASNVLAVVSYAAAAGFVSGALTGLFLWLVNRAWRWNSNEVFACQSIQSYHSFLRFHVTPDELRIYPIGVEVIPTKWRQSRPTVAYTTPAPLLDPVEQPLRAHLIEPVIVVPGARPPTPSPVTSLPASPDTGTPT